MFYNKKLFIHIGTHKTGTSAIQYALRSNYDLLRSHGLVYLKLPKDKIRDILIYNKNIINSLRNQLIEQTERYKEEDTIRFIISDEALSGNTDVQYRNIKVLAKSLKDITQGFDVSIIVYLRRQDQFIQSAYTQKIHQGESYSFNYFLNSFPEDSLDWNQLLDCYADVFGKEKIITRKYDSELFGNANNLIKDFGEIVGCKKLADSSATKLKNIGYSHDTAELARKMNPRLNKPQKKYLRKILQEIGVKGAFKPYSYFNETDRKIFLLKYSESNSLVAKKYFNDESGVLFSDINEFNHDSEKFDLEKCIDLFIKFVKYTHERELENRLNHQKLNHESGSKFSVKITTQIIQKFKKVLSKTVTSE